MVNARAVYPQPMMTRQTEWTGEITPVPRQGGTAQPSPAGRQGVGPDMQHRLSAEAVEAPATRSEAYLGSLKAMLVQNIGNYIVATFLVGTQNTVSWEGILYEVGNDFLTVYQEGRERYIVCDIYSLKYMEFYDTRRREQCDRLLGDAHRQMMP